ncbi:MAG: hypothetical protein IJ557_08525, partial [Bacteroidaceae bacterium]|nr:hypothetical protein [Bacteroidaceae bacterium]
RTIDFSPQPLCLIVRQPRRPERVDGRQCSLRLLRRKRHHPLRRLLDVNVCRQCFVSCFTTSRAARHHHDGSDSH